MHVCLLTRLYGKCNAGFSPDSYASGLSVAVPLLALMGALSLIVEIISAFAKYATCTCGTIAIMPTP